MAATPQTQAVGLVNALISDVLAVINMANIIDEHYQLWTNAQVGTVLQAFPTCAMNPDGTLGSPDSQIDLAHPMNTALEGSPAANIQRALSYNDVISIITALVGVRDAARGSAVAVNGAAIQLFAKCEGA